MMGLVFWFLLSPRPPSRPLSLHVGMRWSLDRPTPRVHEFNTKRWKLSATFLMRPGLGGPTCAARDESATARSETECALRCSVAFGWRSFNFTNGVCVLSDSLNCADSGSCLVWMKSPVIVDNSSNSTTTTSLGYEQLIGDRRFRVFQQRKTGAVSFARNWTDYERGFGDETEFWSGLQSLNSLTSCGNVNLRIEMTARNGTQYVAEWWNFTVGDASTNYTMQFKTFLTASSNVSGDALDYHRGMQFSTFDRDNDKFSASCSVGSGSSGFWYNACVRMVPNGLYSATEMRSAAYMSYYYIHQSGSYNTLREMRMMLQLN